MNIKNVWPLLAIILLTLLLCINKNQMYGMGQDEGTYQVRAMMIMSGDLNQVTVLDEYQKLETIEQRQKYLDFVMNQNNLYIHDSLYDYNNKRDASQFDEMKGIIHGLPTYSYMLAIFGKLFGLRNMLHVQDIALIIGAILIWLTCNNLKFSRTSTIAITLASSICPIVIWLGKSSLTELYLIVINMWFIYYMTHENKEKYSKLMWLPVAAFAFFHISLYVFMPVYILTLWYLNIKNDTKGYLYSAIISCMAYFVGTLWAIRVAPLYSLGNYSDLYRVAKMLNDDNIMYFIGAVCIVCVAVSGLLLVPSLHDTIKYYWNEAEKRTSMWKSLLRAYLLLSVVFFAYKGFVNAPSKTHVEYLNISGYIYLTGLIVIPIIFLILFLIPKFGFGDENKNILGIMFLYDVVFYSTVMRVEIPHYYYYARYIALFVSVVFLYMGIIFRDMDKKMVRLQLVVWIVAVISFVPYDYTLIRGNDDTRAKWDFVERIAEKIEPDSAFIAGKEELEIIFAFPMKALAGCDMYYCDFEDEGTPAVELEFLRKHYNHVYYMDYADDFEERFDLDELEGVHIDKIFKENDQLSYFDYFNITNKLTPFPLRCVRYELPISLYDIN